MGKIIEKKELQRVEVMVPLWIKASRVRDCNGTVGDKWSIKEIQQPSPECLASSQLSHNFSSPEKCLQLCRIT